MTLRLPDHWLWDFWLAEDGEDVHLFFLHAPRSLGNPDLRHSHARIGRLVFGAEDPKGGAVVNGPRFFDQPTCHWRPTVEGGLGAEESSAMLKAFFRARRATGGKT